VNALSPAASDDNPGTPAKPWKTISRAGSARELQPGDTVTIASGVYREHVKITVSGRPGRPITFEAAPGARVVIKGSEIVRGTWERVSSVSNVKEPFPNAFHLVWKIHLGKEYFADPDFVNDYYDKSNWWVSQVFVNDAQPLQEIGPDRIYRNDEFAKIRQIGKGLGDMIDESFFFDPKDDTLYVMMGIEPGWCCMEVGVRGRVLTAMNVHDVVFRGLEMRHNRQPGGQWPMCEVNSSQRVLMEDCKFQLSDFGGLNVSGCKDCVLRRCDFSHNGDSGLCMGGTEDCIVEDCTMSFNNYRRFSPGWHAGGTKNIPDNKRATIRRCEVAYNINSCGIWFDTNNSDIRILDNVVHHNDSCGIFFEINKGGAVIAGNLVYANHDRGIYVAGSQNVWAVHNTVADNVCGIVYMPRDGVDYALRNEHVINNLLLRNYTVDSTLGRGCDLTLFMYPPDRRAAADCASDYNVYADNFTPPTMRPEWNTDFTIDKWRQTYGQDTHSVTMPIQYRRSGNGFELPGAKGLDVAGPLPKAVTDVWKPANPRRVGANLTCWPAKRD
jgi:parallel beta-helix repeat protein